MSTKPHLLLVLPIYNEEVDLERSMRQLYAFAKKELDAEYHWQILVGDNASTDRSPEIYQSLAKEDAHFTFKRLEQKGRGRMLKAIWQEQPYDLSLYMDLDLSTDLSHVQPCLRAIRPED